MTRSILLNFLGASVVALLTVVAFVVSVPLSPGSDKVILAVSLAALLMTMAWLNGPSSMLRRMGMQLRSRCEGIVDMGVRRNVEAALALTYRAIEASMDGIAIVGPDGRFIYANAALARMYQFAGPADLKGRTWRELYDRRQQRRFQRLLSISLRRGGNLQLEAVGLRRDGTPFPQEISLTALADDSFVCVVRDITKRKEVERGLQQQKDFLRKVVDINPSFIFVKDEEGRFMLVNQAVAKAYGTTVENLLGKKDSDFNSNQEEVGHFLSDDLRVIRKGEELFVPEEIITDSTGQRRWLQTFKRPLRLPHSSRIYVLGVATDITERKKLQDQLIQSHKMEAFGQLAGGVAHDFNNIMTGIVGYTALLKMSNAAESENYANAEMIERAAIRASELTHKLMGFARNGKRQNIAVDLHSTIKDTVEILSRTIEKNININLSLQAENPHVMGDPTQLQQVLLNLAINARDAMCLEEGGADGGELVIESRLTGNAASAAAGADFAPSLEILVKDTGCGIKDELLEKIFEPFFTTKSEGRGTGMGLAMVYGIVKDHAGSVSVESKLGRGSAFCIKLPSIKPPPLSAGIEKIKEWPRTGRGQILVVDDHQVVREVTSQMLASLGYEVVTANDGIEAVELYKQKNDRIDLLIIDLVMPRMGARECLRAIRKINPYARAILSTGYLTSSSAVHELLSEGVIGVVEKPYQLAQLSDAIVRAMSH